MINSRSLADLRPVVAAKADAFVTACRAAGVDVLITSTFRDNESQDALYAQGRTAPGKRVTNAKGGQSMHNHRCAFDFVPVVHGKAMWDDARVFKRCGAIAQSLGLEWGGRWVTRPDAPHCQYTGGLTLADLQSGKVPK